MTRLCMHHGRLHAATDCARIQHFVFGQSHAPMSPSLTWEELRGGASPSPSPPAKQRAGLLGSALGAAAQVVKRVANASPGKLLCLVSGCSV